MLYKAEDYLKDDEFIGNFLELVTNVFMDDEALECKNRTLQEVADKVKSMLLPSPEIDSEVSTSELQEMKKNLFSSLGIKL